MKTILTLCLIYQHPRILLGMKKRGFGVGKWNGFGGKVLPTETIEDSVRREVQEEAGIRVKDLTKVGILDFIFTDRTEVLEVHVFKSEEFLGIITESEEMKPQWFHIKNIPFDEMWSDDRFWMPLFLSGKKFKGVFSFGESDTLLEQELVEVEEW
ncbi:8-oxo-dGTP diphosphatase [Candidatus Uhrbacteria bacterium]|nr:8-oxo-dGTP diphosphatase [Candidatus Uhrbacteria bacterium]